MRRTEHRQRPSDNLERLRIEAGLSPRALAAKSNTAPNTIRNAEHGQIPWLEVQKRIADALSIALLRTITPLDLWPMAEEDEEVVA